MSKVIILIMSSFIYLSSYCQETENTAEVDVLEKESLLGQQELIPKRTLVTFSDNDFIQEEEVNYEEELIDNEILDRFEDYEALNPNNYENFNNEECEDFLNECEDRLATLEQARFETKTDVASFQLQDLITELLNECEESIQNHCSN